MELLEHSKADTICSFCLKSCHDVGPLIEGEAGAYVCRECIELCRHIFEMESIRRAVSVHGASTAAEPKRTDKPEMLFRVVGVRAGGRPVVLDELPLERATNMHFRLMMAKVFGNVTVEPIKPPGASSDAVSS
jgi:hypothetical protein